MNTQRVREDTLANLDKLPEKFGDSAFYDPETQCFCFYGWLIHVTEGITPRLDSLGLDNTPVWHALDARYEGFETGRIVSADRIIRAAGGHPQTVVNWMLGSL